MQIGLIGLGKMGRNIGEKWMKEGHEVVVWNRSQEILDKLRTDKSEYIMSQKLVIAHSFEELRSLVRKPRVLWSMLPAGEPTESTLRQLLDSVVENGDIVIDGANSQFKDTERRAAEFEAKSVRFLGIGVSGGIHGFENGYPLMVGGDQSAYEYILPLLDSLTKPYGAHAYFGKGGAGHFVKMVHNAIEYGMMQSLGEGFGIIAKSEYRFNMMNVVKTWQAGSIVASYLLDMAGAAIAKDPSLGSYAGVIDATGEAKWAIDQAKEEKVPTYAIAQALDFRNRSQYDKTVQNTYAARLISAMRFEFGGHIEKKPEQEENVPGHGLES